MSRTPTHPPRSLWRKDQHMPRRSQQLCSIRQFLHQSSSQGAHRKEFCSCLQSMAFHHLLRNSPGKRAWIHPMPWWTVLGALLGRRRDLQWAQVALRAMEPFDVLLGEGGRWETTKSSLWPISQNQEVWCREWDKCIHDSRYLAAWKTNPVEGFEVGQNSPKS